MVGESRHDGRRMMMMMITELLIGQVVRDRKFVREKYSRNDHISMEIVNSGFSKVLISLEDDSIK